MNKNRIAVTFILRSNKIYCRVKFQGTRSEFSTGLDATPEIFKGGRITSKREVDLVKQDEMVDIVSDIRSMKIQSGFTAKMIIDAYLGNTSIGKDVPVMVGQMLNYNINKKKIAKLKPNTIRLYEKAQKHFYSWVKKEKGATDILASALIPSDLLSYQSHIEDLGCQTSTSCLYAKAVKMSIDVCLDDFRGDESIPERVNLDKPREVNKKLQKRKSHANRLTVEEIRKIENLDIKGCTFIKKLPREWYKLTVLWQIYTGFSFSDLANPNWHIEKNINNDEFIVLNRGKNGQESYIPLVPHIRSIMERLKEFSDEYSKKHGFEGLFPFENFYINDNLDKDETLYSRAYSNYRTWMKHSIGIPLGLNIKSHTLRHTFGYIAINIYRMPTDDVAKILGHSNTLTTTRNYADRTIDGMDSSVMKAI